MEGSQFVQDPNAQAPAPDQTPVSTQDAAAAAAPPQDTPAPPPSTPTPSSATPPEPQGQDIAAPPQKPSLWKSILTGALTGLMQGGVVGAVQGAVEHKQIDTDKARSNEMDAQAVNQSKLQTSTAQAHLALINRQISLLPPDRQAAFLDQEADRTDDYRKAGVYQPMSQPMEYADAMNQVATLTKQNPGQYFAAHPVKSNGQIMYQVERDTDTPITSDVTLPLPGGKSVVIPAKSGVTGKQVSQFYTATLQKILDDEAKGENKDPKLTDISIGGKNKKVQVNRDGTTKVIGDSKVTGTPVNPAALTEDATGFKPSLPVTGAAGYQKMYGSFKKNLDDLSQNEQAYQQFDDILSRVKNGQDLTGAQSIVALFNAIGISAEPLKGKGFRINNLTVSEHAEARGLREAIEQKFGKLKTGEIITPNQLKDYADIASQVRENKAVALVNQMHGAKLNADAALPTGNGQPIDPSTQRIFLRLAGWSRQQGKPTTDQIQKAQAMAAKKGWQ